MNLLFRISVLVGLVVSYISTLVCHKNLKLMKDIVDNNEKLEEYYNSIRKQRRKNCLIGCIVGLALAILSFFQYKDQLKSKLVNFFIILLLTPMIIYMLLPNKKYFLEASLYNIELSNEQVVQWFQVYKCMQKSMIIGFLVSFFLTYLCLLVSKFYLNK